MLEEIRLILLLLLLTYNYKVEFSNSLFSFFCYEKFIKFNMYVSNKKTDYVVTIRYIQISNCLISIGYIFLLDYFEILLTTV